MTEQYISRRVEAYLSCRDHESALWWCERLLAERPCAEYRLMLAQCYLHAHQPSKAYGILKNDTAPQNRFTLALAAYVEYLSVPIPISVSRPTYRYFMSDLRSANCMMQKWLCLVMVEVLKTQCNLVLLDLTYWAASSSMLQPHPTYVHHSRMYH